MQRACAKCVGDIGLVWADRRNNTHTVADFSDGYSMNCCEVGMLWSIIVRNPCRCSGAGVYDNAQTTITSFQQYN